MSHKTHLLSYTLRCSSKLQDIQSLETLFQWPSKVHNRLNIPLGSLSKMVLLLLSLFTLMIRRPICLPNLLTANGLNSFTKTLVSSPWIDLSFSSFFLMHLHLVLCIALFNLFLFVFFSVLVYFVFHIKKIEKSEKYKNNVCMWTLVLVYLGWPLKQSFLNFVSFVA